MKPPADLEAERRRRRRIIDELSSQNPNQLQLRWAIVLLGVLLLAGIFVVRGCR